nr:hypothetical protein CFP56_33406 [Quercus suber]
MSSQFRKPASQSFCEPKERWLFRGVGGRVETIDVSTLRIGDTLVSSRDEPALICSYNWADRKIPTIFVPGGAPLWASQALPKTIPHDSGKHFIDQNGSRMPEYPFEAMFRAVDTMRPEYRFDQIDVIVNRNSLRKLLDHCHGRKQGGFRINLHVIGNTLIIERCEKSAEQIIYGSAPQGYGHNFERAFTTPQPGLEDCIGHHRVLRYGFGELTRAVQFEVDACCGASAEESFEMDGGPETPHTNLETDRHASFLDSLQLSPKRPERAPFNSPAVAVIRCGTGTAQGHTAEIKTKTKSISLGKVMPQLWFGRVGHLIRSYHVGGSFGKVDMTQITDEFSTWEAEEKNQIALRKMAAVLSSLRQLVQRNDGHMCVAIVENARHTELQVLSSSGWQARKPLPDDLISKFWKGRELNRDKQ